MGKRCLKRPVLTYITVVMAIHEKRQRAGAVQDAGAFKRVFGEEADGRLEHHLFFGEDGEGFRHAAIIGWAVRR